MTLKIGTRKSKLALWQANYIANELNTLGVQTALIKIESFGDKEQDLPLHKLGDKGVFTKALDEALLLGKIDIAVHSLKDVPTDLHPDLKLASVPRRANPMDTLVKPSSPHNNFDRIIATGSIRRRAFWKNRFPTDEVVDLRGNVPTRLRKVDSNEWYGAIFAYAGLERLGLQDRISEVLNWIIPAPSQGAMGILSHKNTRHQEVLSKLEDADSRICVDIERSFMNELEAGCSSPVGGFAKILNHKLQFKGAVLTIDGSQRMDTVEVVDIEKAAPVLGIQWARELKDKGAMDFLNTRGDE
ncbi:MAG: hydroxymethylbilane synthase [Balneolaceae bacterium]|nr:hydroxymethylbilane synthase [Balneolaceae bacterium]